MCLARLSFLALLIAPWASVTAQDTAATVQPLQVMGVTITGSKITKDRIILRELLVQEGDTVDAAAIYDKLERSRQNLMNLSLFNTVTVLPLYLDGRHVMIEVTVNERWTICLLYTSPSPRD